jgi:hypothetical protein
MRSLTWTIAAFCSLILLAPARAQPASAPTTAPVVDPSSVPAEPSSEPTTPMGAVGDTPANIRLRRLEQRVEALKEQTYNVKRRVGMLKEAVLGGGIGARASITHENKMGGSFRLIKLVYALDGAQIFSRVDDSGKMHDQKLIDILSGPIAPGNHTVSVMMVYRGHGYGVFSYLKGYKFTVRSSHTFAVSEGKLTEVTVVGFEKGGATTPLEKRPAVDFRVSISTEKAKTE